MLLLTVGLAARHSVGLLETDLEQNLNNVAQLLATNQLIIDAMEAGKVSPSLEKYLDDILANDNNIDIITLADMRAIRLYHPVKERIGQAFQGGDEGPALKGENYSSKAEGTLGYQKRYFYPVFDSDGKQLGFVHVSMLMKNLELLRNQVVVIHLQTLLAVFLVGAVASVFLAANIKRSLLGLEPYQIAASFLKRGEIMDSLEEGLLAIDERGSVILHNDSAGRMLELEHGDLVGKDIDEHFPQFKLKETLTGLKEHNRQVALNEQVIICDRLPINARDQIIGGMAILRDRSEVTKLAEQITGFNHVVDALRSNTHEFMNQLHVILGLLQGGEYEEAKQFITKIGHAQSATVSTVAKNIDNRVLAALILGKINRCQELGVRMIVQPQSTIPRHSLFLSTQSLLTVVGNLVENAIEAINAKADPEADDSITLLIYEDKQSLLITLDDTGIGLTQEEIVKMSQYGYTTKGAGRGTGLGLVRGLVQSSSGEFTVESEKGVGTSMMLTFTTPRPGRKPAPAEPRPAESGSEGPVPEGPETAGTSVQILSAETVEPVAGTENQAGRKVRH
ncbi:MAG: sensor histidine kinase [Deltaproteobacteria bacterium]|jgi:sensor histidine kinase regulating citrate/malate metabolism|nr:sensor histidine kinase [Deltaproteobacteria bacterium]